MAAPPTHRCQSCGDMAAAGFWQCDLCGRIQLLCLWCGPRQACPLQRQGRFRLIALWPREE